MPINKRHRLFRSPQANGNDRSRNRGIWAAYARVEETGDPRENPLTRGIVRHESHVQKSESGPAGNRIRFALVTEPPAPQTGSATTDCATGDLRQPTKNDTSMHVLKDPALMECVEQGRRMA
ncbi:hypothetical protein PR048_004997 [Dryococelus australis]|uniref:Uncharacterized protein n=1 Tax=Dryococelus australis TaxID=614101 RepID=A0ABQ9I7F3_9NEOP|nr:hypothetical protein PR048_004997 [Dryococelus australis]